MNLDLDGSMHGQKICISNRGSGKRWFLVKWSGWQSRLGCLVIVGGRGAPPSSPESRESRPAEVQDLIFKRRTKLLGTGQRSSVVGRVSGAWPWGGRRSSESTGIRFSCVLTTKADKSHLQRQTALPGPCLGLVHASDPKPRKPPFLSTVPYERSNIGLQLTQS